MKTQKLNLGKSRHLDCGCYRVCVCKPHHTPTPWSHRDCVLEKFDDEAMAKTIGRMLEPKDAAMIVRAVNSHQDMLDTLKSIDPSVLPLGAVLQERIAKAIAKAEGK